MKINFLKNITKIGINMPCDIILVIAAKIIMQQNLCSIIYNMSSSEKSFGISASASRTDDEEYKMGKFKAFNISKQLRLVTTQYNSWPNFSIGPRSLIWLAKTVLRVRCPMIIWSIIPCIFSSKIWAAVFEWRRAVRRPRIQKLERWSLSKTIGQFFNSKINKMVSSNACSS